MAKPDNRNDNVEKLQEMKRNTQHNIEAAEEAIAETNMSSEQKQDVRAKNERREESIEAFESEMEDEKRARQNGYKNE
ncbi:small acid-soluble spore protein Tlp [Alkalihalobacillus hemicellulosilyticus]|uniref:Small, acid-soluble spore protein Tlp n=1 Tax=Halalkalibacter hemicellulosilyticusJCM 9152 TaxID=1236971 RepID=W4QGX8_9BACI|nr:small acid-soluble spore protein Tlp [Halalkalibacter hemicellulosilyticus]GAE30898.1 small, acid-soluble spore protein [Halalkalibacter hemicellulosilyticusJCM 9152]